MNPKIGLKDLDRTGVIKILDATLADEYLLYTETRNAHWNVTGPQFNDLHKFFEAQYEELNDIVDDTAERARALGGRALGSLAEFLKETRLKEMAPRMHEAEEILTGLLNQHETLIRHLRTDLDDCQ